MPKPISNEKEMGLQISKARFALYLAVTLLSPFAITFAIQGSSQELSKAVFALYLIIPTATLAWLIKGKPEPLYGVFASLLWSVLENMDWRLYLSQQINEAFHLVINPQWALILISGTAFAWSTHRALTHKSLWTIFCAIGICASLSATYTFHYLVINNGIRNAVKDHEQKMMLLDTENQNQQSIVCAILGIKCIQSDYDGLLKKLTALNFDRQSIISINDYSKGKQIFYAWRETDIVSAALNGNGVLIGYINKNDKPIVVIDREKYSVTMNREENLFMYLVILFHSIWIPGWIYISHKHRRITIK